MDKNFKELGEMFKDNAKSAVLRSKETGKGANVKNLLSLSFHKTVVPKLPEAGQDFVESHPEVIDAFLTLVGMGTNYSTIQNKSINDALTTSLSLGIDNVAEGYGMHNIMGVLMVWMQDVVKIVGDSGVVIDKVEDVATKKKPGRPKKK